MTDRPAVFVHLLPSLVPPGALPGTVAVVVDVLRATTAMIHALAAGCKAVIPCAEVEEARTVAASLPPGTAILGGERGGLPIEGFDRGNSPGEFTPEVCRGKTLVMTTTNGTRAILASLEADRVLVGAFVNLAATCRAIEQELRGSPARAVHLVCSGTEGFVSLEDTLLAGALVRAVSASQDHPTPAGNDQALIAAAAAPRDFAGLAGELRRGRGGQNVVRIGLEKDIADAARVDRFPFAAELRRNPLRIVRADQGA
jgi:2-phosphosulfolactate phosphatase